MVRPHASTWRRLLPLVAVGCIGNAASAQFTIDNARIPATGSFTENVDFADVDLDGDWDVALADGGDQGNDQNRIWINDGNAQGGTIGFFTDRTAQQAPSLQDDSRDIEFVDFDNDGDQDIYVSNTAQITNQGNRWWVNLGGQQAGTAGFYADQTAARWIGLGAAGSSIASNQIVGGSFIDWSCDCDFGDLDNDGDMDLVHSSYGGSFGGSVPTRLFLNNGAGQFEEFNPSGVQLTGPTISNGTAGLWCDGDQSSDTTNSNGSFCDIATTALDIDVGDIDGDFDLDILHGARNEAPRMFANRLDASNLAPEVGGGALGFRDVTGAVFPSGYTQGTFGHYEQEMGDMDGDGDLDVYGLNWLFSGFSFDDITLRNNGDGTFSGQTTLPGSTADDNEGDFFDADNDGDLDLYVANFTGQDKLYRNTNGLGNYQLVSIPSFASISLDADIADVDEDGDYDILVGEDNGADQTFLRNINDGNDLTAPYIPNVEDIGPFRAARSRPFPVRAQVYDNAPYYITWFNPTKLLVTVGGVALPDITAMSSGGQIFRAEIPGNLVGRVRYQWESQDAYSNVGTSATTTYEALYRDLTPSMSPASPATSSGNTGPQFQRLYGQGWAAAQGEPTIDSLSVPFAGSSLFLHGGNATPGTRFVMLVWDTALASPLSVGNLTVLNALGTNLFAADGYVDANGDAVVAVDLPQNLAAGTKLYAQFFTAEGAGSMAWASSRGLAITTR